MDRQCTMGHGPWTDNAPWTMGHGQLYEVTARKSSDKSMKWQPRLSLHGGPCDQESRNKSLTILFLYIQNILYKTFFIGYGAKVAMDVVHCRLGCTMDHGSTMHHGWFAIAMVVFKYEPLTQEGICFHEHVSCVHKPISSLVRKHQKTENTKRLKDQKNFRNTKNTFFCLYISPLFNIRKYNGNWSL